MRPCILMILLVPAAALGQVGSSDSKAAANALFDEGRRLMEAGDVEKACGKFEASLAALPQLGTRLNLARCYEELGRLASAWAEFREVASQAAKTSDRREPIARERVAALEPRLSRMVIKLAAGASIPELRITRDGVVVLPALMETAVPVDPGRHVVAATAPGYRPWQRDVIVAGEKQTVTVEIAPLERLVEPERPALVQTPDRPAPPVEGDPGRSRRILGLGVGGAGVAAMGVGLVFGLRAKSRWDEAHEKTFAEGGCDDDRCAPEGGELVDQAHSAATVATVLVGVGIAAVAGGAVLYFTAPRRGARDTALRVDPETAPGYAGLRLSGTF